jgi:hypothetical protein
MIEASFSWELLIIILCEDLFHKGMPYLKLSFRKKKALLEAYVYKENPCYSLCEYSSHKGIH